MQIPASYGPALKDWAEKNNIRSYQAIQLLKKALARYDDYESVYDVSAFQNKSDTEKNDRIFEIMSELLVNPNGEQPSENQAENDMFADEMIGAVDGQQEPEQDTDFDIDEFLNSDDDLNQAFNEQAPTPPNEQGGGDLPPPTDQEDELGLNL